MRTVLFAGAVLAAGAAGYGLYRATRPPLRIQSDRVVRAFVRDASREIRKVRRRVRTLRREGRLSAAALERLRARALERIHALADAARDRIDEMDLHFQTQRNRLNRIDARLAQTEAYLQEIVAKAERTLPGTAASKTPTPGGP